MLGMQAARVKSAIVALWAQGSQFVLCTNISSQHSASKVQRQYLSLFHECHQENSRLKTGRGPPCKVQYTQALWPCLQLPRSEIAISAFLMMDTLLVLAAPGTVLTLVGDVATGRGTFQGAVTGLEHHRGHVNAPVKGLGK